MAMTIGDSIRKRRDEDDGDMMMFIFPALFMLDGRDRPLMLGSLDQQ
jgi:hypothetical protein